MPFAAAAVLMSIVSSGLDPPEFWLARFKTISGAEAGEPPLSSMLITISGVDAAGVAVLALFAGGGAGAGAGAEAVSLPAPAAAVAVLLAWA